MIKNYGLLWNRKYVHFGAGSNKGTLLGRKSSVGKVDFRDQIGVYVLYDKDLNPIYVGQAGNGNANLFMRLKAHRSDNLRNRWEYFSWFGLKGINKNKSKSLSERDSAEKIYGDSGGGVLNQLEGILIAAMEPKLNRQGAKFPKAQHFHQEIDENILDLSFEDVSDKLDTIQLQIGKLQKKLEKK